MEVPLCALSPIPGISLPLHLFKLFKSYKGNSITMASVPPPTDLNHHELFPPEYISAALFKIHHVKKKKNSPCSPSINLICTHLSVPVPNLKGLNIRTQVLFIIFSAVVESRYY